MERQIQTIHSEKLEYTVPCYPLAPHCKSSWHEHYHLLLFMIMRKTEVSDKNQGLQTILKNLKGAIKCLMHRA